MTKYKTDPKYACTYMEIPQNDINKAERDFGLFGKKEPHTPPEKDTGMGTFKISPIIPFPVHFVPILGIQNQIGKVKC